MTLDQLITNLTYFANQGCGDFDVVAPDKDGNLTVRELGAGVADPTEKLIAIGCGGFVLREDLK